MAVTARAEEHGEGSFECECGRTFAYGGAYTKHKLKCDGKPAPTSRIAGGSGSGRAEAAKIVAIDEAPSAPAKRARGPRVTKPARTGRPRKAVRDPKVARRRAQFRNAKARKRGTAVEVIKATLVDAAISPKQMLAALRAERVKIDNAIAAVEALG